jgi:hypothetical protein
MRNGERRVSFKQRSRFESHGVNELTGSPTPPAHERILKEKDALALERNGFGSDILSLPSTLPSGSWMVAWQVRSFMKGKQANILSPAPPNTQCKAASRSNVALSS